MLGWVVDSVNDEELRFLHLRPMGSSQNGILTGRVRWGYGQYFMGTSPLFILASAAYRLPRHPMLTGSLAMLWGFASSAIKRAPRYEDTEFRRFLRRYQRLSLVIGKSAAAKRLSAQQAKVWESRHPASPAARPIPAVDPAG
jgi:hypothetical protein